MTSLYTELRNKDEAVSAADFVSFSIRWV